MLDLVFDGLQALEGTESIVLGVKDSFFSLCIRPAERRSSLAIRGRYYIFNRLAQGFRGAPLAWCRFFALVVRLTLGLFAKEDAEIHVDDPVITLMGSREAVRGSHVRLGMEGAQLIAVLCHGPGPARTESYLDRLCN